MKNDITEKIKIILDNHKKCFYGFCEDCIFYKDCNKNNCECDCSKFHLDKIRTLINSILPDQKESEER